MTNPKTSISPTFSQEPIKTAHERVRHEPELTAVDEYELVDRYITDVQEALAALKRTIKKNGILQRHAILSAPSAKAWLRHDKVLVVDATRFVEREVRFMIDKIGHFFAAVEKKAQEEPNCSACSIFENIADKGWRKKFDECKNKCSKCLERVHNC